MTYTCDETISWPAPDTFPSLKANEIHVWAARLDLSPEARRALAAMLNETERLRAARFKFDLHRDRFIAGRGCLRVLLGRYLGVPPAALEFSYGPHGKPSLTPASGAGIQFNLAHSEDLAVIGIARTVAVGVDVERIRPVRDMEDLVARFFSRRESDRFRTLRVDEKPAAFFNLWTRKEAWLKATGEGITRSLDRVDVSFLAGEPARLLMIDGSAEQAAGWTLCDLTPGPGFAGALAVQLDKPIVRQWACPTDFRNEVR